LLLRNSATSRPASVLEVGRSDGRVARVCWCVCVRVLRKGGRAAEGGGCIALHRLAEAFVLTA
jgi:hypothetical protein